MLKLNSLSRLIIIGIFSLSSVALAADSYAESQLRDAYEQEVAEKTRLEELERKAAREKADYERQVRETEQLVESKRIQTENYKMKSEELLSQLETLNVELFELRTKHNVADKEITFNEEKYLKVQTEYDAIKKEHEQQKVTLEKKEIDLKALKEKLEASIARYKLESEKMKQDIAVMDAEIAASDAKRAELESAEMQVRVEWLATRKEAQDKRELKASYIAQSEEARKKLETAKKDLVVAQNELAKMTKEVVAVGQKTRADVAKYEKDMVEISHKKALADSEKIHVELETQKLKTYADQVKANRNDQQKSLSESNSALIQSRMALESVKTDLTKAVASDQKSEFENQKLESRMRGLASAAEANEILDGGRLFVTTKNCPARRRPASDSPEVIALDSGRKLLGRESIGNWVKITSEGHSVYVDKSCGKFEDK